jgi:hypothetical protein
MTTDSIVTAAVITVKDSAEAIFRPIANLPSSGDGNQLIAQSTALISKMLCHRATAPQRKII